MSLMGKYIEPPHVKTNKMTFAPSEDSDQPSLISLLCAQWVAMEPSFLHADSEDSDQTAHTDLSLLGTHAILLVLS